MNINDLKKGESALISNIDGDLKLRKRLLALGCLQDTEVTLINKAPLGDPVIIEIRGFCLALRKKDAHNISVKKEIS